MSKKIIAWDLGTGGNKAALYDADGNCLEAVFVAYPTTYPNHGWHEQRPEDWWKAVVESTRQLLQKTGIDKSEIDCCGLSGHSLGAVPVDRDGHLLRESTPIWSDSRPVAQTVEFFKKFDELEWYRLTGSGFPPALYAAFKIMWYRDNEPDMFKKIYKVIGTKDYINLKLTGRIVTDPSYASGYGVYDLVGWKFSEALIAATGLSPDIFPEIVPSTEVIGEINREAAEALGLAVGTKVVAGGVDNSCMALGARAFKEGRVYSSLGSCIWIAASSQKPILDDRARPYVFAHVLPGYYASALCIASGGTSFNWVVDNTCADLKEKAAREKSDFYAMVTEMVQKSPVGANKLLFNPNLAGGMPIDPGVNVRGGFLGLDLGHTRGDLLRSTMEGIALSLRICLDELRKLTPISDEMLIVGGGSKSPVWRQIYADAYKSNIIKSSVDQHAAALGAAAVAAVGTGKWSNFDRIDAIHQVESVTKPIAENSARYEKMLPLYQQHNEFLSRLGDSLRSL
jgi:xylulokinase